MAKLTVGKFIGDTETFAIEGPADYMTEQFPSAKATIEAGKNPVVNYGTTHGYPLFQTVLVAIQTDYAGWLGMKEAEGWLKGGK